MTDKERHSYLMNLMENQPLWWSLFDGSDILVKHNTPRGSVVFAWPSATEAKAWRDDLIVRFGAPLAGFAPGPIEYVEVEKLLTEGGYQMLALGELPGQPGLSILNVRQ